MKYQIQILIPFILICFNGFSQIHVTDLHNNPIPFVQVISNNKQFFAQSDLKGEIGWSNFGKLINSDTLFFHHVSYETTFKIKGELYTQDTIKLRKRVYELKEFSVLPKESKNKYQKINACYRSYQANNDSVTYYTDGKAEYLSKVNKDNFKILKKQYRTLANTRLEDEVIHRKVEVTFTPSVPSPPFDYLPFEYFKENKVKLVTLSNDKKEIRTEENILIGEIERPTKYIKYSINDVFSVSTRKAFNTEVNLVKLEVIMLFRNSEITDETSINNFDNLVYAKSTREFKVKHDKEKSYTKILNIDELFVEEVSYSQSREGTEKFQTGFGMPKKSIYQSAFWNTCDCEAYYPVPSQIIKGLHER